MELSDILASEVKILQQVWGASFLLEGGFVNVTIPDVKLLDGKFIAAATPDSEAVPGTPLQSVEVLLRIPVGYPHAPPDMFWVRPHVRLVGGGMPGAADQLEVHQGKQWQRFSWHLAQTWKPLVYTLTDTYVPFVLRRLREGS